MIDLQLTTGGFPLSNNRLINMQTAWNEIKKILPVFGN